MNKMIYLSIVIPIRNEERFIKDTLQSMAAQDYPKSRYELIVVDGISTDGTLEKVDEFRRSYPGVNIKVLSNPGRLSSAARNIGARAAVGEFIAVIDGHVHIPDNRLFRSIEDIAEKNTALCLSRPAPLLVPGLDSGSAHIIARARKTWIGHSKASYIYSSFEGFVSPVSSGFAYRRKVFELIGYFDESFDAAEDVEFNFRLEKAGIQAYTSPALIIYSYPRDDYKSLFRQQTRYGAGRARFIRKHPEGFSLETTIPAAIFLFFSIMPAMMPVSVFYPAISVPYWFAAVFYSSMLVATGIRECVSDKGLLSGFKIAYALWVIHMGLGWGFLKTLLTGKT